MRAFITGATGFVGGHLCERLRREGWEVRALVRNRSKARDIEAVGCETVPGDLDSAVAIRQAAGDTDAIFHLAGVTKAVHPADFARVNGHGTGKVAAAAAAGGFQGRFVHLSSLAAAGPAIEGRPRTEAMPAQPVSYYGRGKLMGERFAARARSRFPVTILRPGAIYGPREHEIHEVVRQLARTGVAFSLGPEIRLQMTHVEDIVEAAWRAATVPEAVNRTYFVTDPQVWTFSRIMSLLGEALGRRVRVIPLPLVAGWAAAAAIDTASLVARKPLSPFNRDKMRELAAGSWLADSTLLTRETGWEARWGLVEGLRDTIGWYRENGWLPAR